MKKNLFLLFCIYFFVVQAVIIGLIWQESYMYLLALINLVAIVLILVLYKAAGLSDDEEKHPIAHHEDKEVIHHHEPVRAKKTTPKGKSVKLILAIIFAILFYILLMGAGFGFRLIATSVIALVIMFFVYLFGGSLRHFFRYLGTKILLVILGLGIVIFGYQFSFQNSAQPLSLGSYIQQNFSSLTLFAGSTTDTDDNYILSGEGTVLGTGTTTGEASKDVLDLFSGMQTSDIITGNTETTTPPTTTEPVAQGSSIHMGDMIKHLLTSHNVSLLTTKDVKFTYVSYSNELYPYFRTAYAKTMIGSSTNPTKLALCDTYMVMKGILEKRPVTYTKTNVLQKYRDYASTNDKLNGCVQGKVLKESNL